MTLEVGDDPPNPDPLCLEGRGDFACEVRRESIILHWENSGNSLCPVWPNDAPHVEFETRHLDDMIAALQQARRYLKKTALPAKPGGA